MEEKQLASILALFDASSANVLDLQEGNLHLRLEKAPVTVSAEARTMPAETEIPLSSPAAALSGPEEEPKAAAHEIRSALVGIYHEASSPSASPFVQAGDPVEPGQILCIVESMKVMNEICSDTAGIVCAVHRQEGDLVEFDQLLFEITPEAAG